ncbi:MAG: hypothetical protein SF029_12805 [bacterium]|nr:hypothetical protein [bacterium]
MFTLHDAMPTAPCQNSETLLKFLGGNNGRPLTAYRLRRNARFVAHYPAGIEPVVEDMREGVLVGFAFPICLDLHEGATTAIVVSAPMEFFTDFIQCHPIRQQQVPCQPPDETAFGILLNPTHVFPMLGLHHGFGFLLTVDVAIRWHSNEAPCPQFGVQPTGHPLPKFNRLAACQRK